MTLTTTDLFAGAGGSSSGLVQVPGIEVRIAANHWQLACDVHNATRHRWPNVPAEGMITFVNPAKVRRKRDPGRCFLRAGFRRIGLTGGGLHVLHLSPDAMPDPQPARGEQLGLAL